MEREVEIIKNIGKVKRVKRAGWVREGIPEVESVADHSFRVAVMAMIFGERLDVDVNTLVGMSLIHDLAEGIQGEDKVVERGANIDHERREPKDRDEIAIIRNIFNHFPGVSRIIDLQEETTEGQSKEAIILKQLERLEMAVQALEYEEEYGNNLSEFFENAEHHIQHPFLKEILEEVKSQRPNRYLPG